LLTNKTVLVTGGGGFIGSNIIEALLKLDNTVICLDNFATGFKHNLEQALQNKNFTLIEGDITNLSDCQKATKGVDVVLHQAALGSVPRSIADPANTNNVNVTGFLNMLIASRDAGVKRFVYAASSSTYGDHPGLPKVEDKIGKPLSPYAVTKYVNELYADVFAKTYQMEVIGLRYFNVFGRKQTPEGAYAAAIPKFIKAFINYESPEIHGDGGQTRDFTYIDNVIQANLLAGSTQNTEALNQVYNVAYGSNITVKELVLYLREQLSAFDAEIAKVEPKFAPPRQGDVRNSLASINKAETLLGYKPTHDLKQGLAEAMQWYWNNLKQ
jgi:UDP-N-acetylglucosamine 4-epimerase